MLSSKLNLPKLKANISKITPQGKPRTDLRNALMGSTTTAELKRLEALQTAKIKEYMGKSSVGLVNDPADQFFPHLVVAKEGIRVLGMDGRPIKDIGLKTPTQIGFSMSAMTAMVTMLAGPNFEKNIEHMYLDSGGLVTAGIGHLIENETEALKAHKKLQFIVKATGVTATDAEVKAEFNFLRNNRAQYANRQAEKFKSIVSLEFPKASSRKLAEIDINDVLGQLRSGTPFPPVEFNSWPEGVQMALVDIVFNIGKQGFINEFKILPVALLNRDWKSAQAESSRSGTPSARNNAVAALFDQAILTEKFFISIDSVKSNERYIIMADGTLAKLKPGP